MTIGIICAAALGIIALYQTWAARNYRDAALLFQQALEARKVRQRAVAEAIGRAHDAALTGDTQAVIGALRSAVVAAAGDKAP